MTRLERKVNRMAIQEYKIQLYAVDKKYAKLFTEEIKNFIKVDFAHEDFPKWITELQKVSYSKIRKTIRKKLKKAGV